MTGPWTCSGDWWTILRLIWKQSFPNGLAEVTSQSRLAAAKQMHEMKNVGQCSQGLYCDSQTALWVRANILASRRHSAWYTNASCVKRCFAWTKLENILHVKESTHKLDDVFSFADFRTHGVLPMGDYKRRVMETYWAKLQQKKLLEKVRIN